MMDTRSHLLCTFQKKVEADRRQWQRCQRGAHNMLATATPGIVEAEVWLLDDIEENDYEP